jgi:hypothetical protein
MKEFLALGMQLTHLKIECADANSICRNQKTNPEYGATIIGFTRCPSPTCSTASESETMARHCDSCAR